MTADLNEKKQDVPDALVPSVEQLSTVLQTVNDDRTPPQERDGALRTARQVTSALEVISDPGTPQAARRQLTGLVKQLTSTLDVANSPRTSPEEGRVLTLLADRSASALRAFGAPETPPALAADLAATLQNLLPQSAEDVAANASIPVRLRETVAAAVQAASDPRNGDDERKGLAQSAHETSSSWHDRGSSGSSDDKRRLEKQLKEAAAAQGLPDETLGKAAAACTNTLFELVSDATLAKELRSLTPDTWNSQGVQDFWKSREEANDSLDVYAQLQNHKVDDTSLAIRRLLPRLSDAVSADDLISTVGPPALHCLQAALELDRDAGVSSGSWVSAAEQI
ncbi:hypothetical protein [Streptomyces sp. NBC_00847]|uniref:hypothetical protein n=1 Tax=Streptomyces sp. NBC_00847 TaxID=2975850 RepID=UPI002251DE8F|nr:hypothetical protein [Streptomyces sp. NBC_00847]MCX4880324.1 hypothetical protein [Streptomyces sp. NBC_00847]